MDLLRLDVLASNACRQCQEAVIRVAARHCSGSDELEVFIVNIANEFVGRQIVDVGSERVRQLRSCRVDSPEGPCSARYEGSG